MTSLGFTNGKQRLFNTITALAVAVIVLLAFGVGTPNAAENKKEAGSPAVLTTIKSAGEKQNGNIYMSGELYYQINEYNYSLRLVLDRVTNDNLSGTSGTLKVFLFASDSYYNGGTLIGYDLGGFTLGQLASQSSFVNIDEVTDYYPPDYGTYWIVMILTEQDFTGEDLITDWYTFESQETLGSSGGGGGGGGGGSGGGCFIGSALEISKTSRVKSQKSEAENRD